MASNTTGMTNGVPNGWTKNERIKTCKCEACNQKVKFWSYQCVKCRRHICSKCLDPGSDREPWPKLVAKAHISDGCWGRFDSNMDPRYAAQIPPPPHNEKEERRDRESKRLAASNRMTKPKGTRSRKSAKLHEDASPSPADHLASSLPDDDYDDSQTFGPTITATKPHRKGRKRKHYTEEDSEDEVFLRGSSGRLKKRKASERVHQKQQDVAVDEENVDANNTVLAPLRGGATVIVGAGVVGLFIAREIALEAKEAGIERPVIVIELRKSYCELASGYSAGFLSTKDMPEDWDSVANYAKQWWLDIVSSADIRKQLQFHSNTASMVVDSASQSQGKAPSWLREDVEWSLLEDRDAVGLINPASLAAWLYNQCGLLDVRFCFEKSIFDVDFDTGSKLSSVQIRNASDDSNSAEGIPCRNLVLAAGPFTTRIFSKLFMNTPLELENHVQASNWFQVKTAAMMSGASAAFRFPHAAESEGRIDNEIYMITDPSDNSIAVSGIATHVRHIALSKDLAEESKHGKTSELKVVAAKVLKANETDVETKSNIIRRGCSELSVANGMRPIIDGVPASGIERAFNDEEDDSRPCGVWLCYGFGKFGTMLAPGAAKILVEKMFGKMSDLMAVHDDFRLPPYQKPQTKGKGKAKAYDTELTP